MQGKVLVALAVVGLIAFVLYMRTKGPWCGDDRCERRQYCLVQERDARNEPEHFTCEELPDECGFWPTCGCVGLPDDVECDTSIFGYVTAETTVP